MKSILDVGATLERLESLGITVVGMGTDRFPGFYLSDSGFPVDASVTSVEEVAAIMRARADLGTDHAALVVANPLPRRRAGRSRAPRPPPRGGPGGRRRRGGAWEGRHPFLLERFHAESDGESLRANVAIILRNASLAARIAVAALVSASVVVVGDVMVDVVVVPEGPLAPGSDTPSQVHNMGGGSAANTACWLASLGTPVRLAAAVGADELGRVALGRARGARGGLRRQVEPKAATGSCVVLIDGAGERTMLPDRGANEDLAPAVVEAAIDRDVAWVHVSGYALLGAGSHPAAQAAMAAARRLGLPWSVDAASSAPLRAAGPSRFLRWIEGCTVLFANDDELAALGGAADALRCTDEVVVKLGPAGASWTDGTRSEASPAAPATVVDTIGAGDAFDAGFLAARLGGADPAASLHAGTLAAARAVSQRGARP